MHLYKLAIGIILGVLLSVASGSVEAKELKIQGSFYGAFSPIDSDGNNDGLKASLNLVTGRGNLGRFSGHAQSEVLPPLPAPVTCPAGTVEFPYLGIAGITTFINKGDQLFSFKGHPGTLCANFATGTFTFQITETYYGGTGQFTGATGSVLTTGSGHYSFCDPAEQCFGSQTGTFTGTIILP